MGSLAFSRDGSLFAAGLNAGTVRLWDVATDDQPLPAGSLVPALDRDEALAWHRRKADEAERAHTAARFHLDFLIEAEPDNAQHRLVRGRLAKDSRVNLDLALADLMRATELEPLLTEAWELAAQIHLNSREFDLAESLFTRAINNGSDSPSTYAGRGRSLAGLKRWQEAVPDFSEALKPMPGQWSHQQGRADAWAELGEWDKAFADFQALHAAHPGAGLQEQILIQLHVGNTPLARELCDGFIKRLLETDSSMTKEHLISACVQLSQEPADIASVIAFAKGLVEDVPAYSPYRYRYGQLLYRTGLYSDALAEIQKADDAATGGSTVRGLFYTALIHHHLGEADKATMAFEAGIQKREEVNAKAEELNIHVKWTTRLEMDRIQAEATELLGSGQ